MTTPATQTEEKIRQSRVGKRPVTIPKGVTLSIANGKMSVKGPKGELSRAITPNVDITVDGPSVTVKPTVSGRDGARFQGLARALLQSMVTGCAEGYTKVLERLVREHPEQYFWQHRRWKGQPKDTPAELKEP